MRHLQNKQAAQAGLKNYSPKKRQLVSASIDRDEMAERLSGSITAGKFSLSGFISNLPHYKHVFHKWQAGHNCKEAMQRRPLDDQARTSV